jgi:hypothetical protein
LVIGLDRFGFAWNAKRATIRRTEAANEGFKLVERKAGRCGRHEIRTGRCRLGGDPLASRATGNDH